MKNGLNLSLPKDWLSLSDRQLLFFFSLLSQDRAMEELSTLNSSLDCRTDSGIGPMQHLSIGMDYI